MRPYFRVIRNLLKLYAIKIFKCRGLSFRPVQLFGSDVKLSLHPTAKVNIGDRVSNDGVLTVVVSEGGELTVGDNMYFNNGMYISVKSKVEIGSGCQFGPNVCIFDNNHRFTANEGVQLTHKASPIHIGKSTWVGANCVILKGTKIGENCVIGAGCVVSGSIPDRSLVTMDRKLLISEIK